MTCPYCKYKDGWDSETLNCIEGKKGAFYIFPIMASRINCFDTDSIKVCPQCKKLFAEEEG